MYIWPHQHCNCGYTRTDGFLTIASQLVQARASSCELLHSRMALDSPFESVCVLPDLIMANNVRLVCAQQYGAFALYVANVNMLDEGVTTTTTTTDRQKQRQTDNTCVNCLVLVRSRHQAARLTISVQLRDSWSVALRSQSSGSRWLDADHLKLTSDTHKLSSSFKLSLSLSSHDSVMIQVSQYRTRSNFVSFWPFACSLVRSFACSLVLSLVRSFSRLVSLAL